MLEHLVPVWEEHRARALAIKLGSHPASSRSWNGGIRDKGVSQRRNDRFGFEQRDALRSAQKQGFH